MEKLLAESNSKEVFLARWKEIALLHLLWLICSIPIITIGASTTAVHYVCIKLIKGEEMAVKDAFFKSFKQNIIQSTIIWSMFIVFAIGLGSSFVYLFLVSKDSNTILKILIGITTLIVVLSYVYTLPLIARYMNTLKKQILNSVMISVRYLDRTVKIILMFAVFIAIGFYSVTIAVVLFLLLATCIFYVITSYMLPVYDFLEQHLNSQEDEEIIEEAVLLHETDEENVIEEVENE